VKYVCQSDHDYYLCDDVPSFGYAIDVTQKFVDRYNAYEAEREFIQSKLHKYYTEAKEKELLKKCEAGVPSKGF
jgi:uncharacterized protein (DUF4213/DUF364 family)